MLFPLSKSEVCPAFLRRNLPLFLVAWSLGGSQILPQMEISRAQDSGVVVRMRNEGVAGVTAFLLKTVVRDDAGRWRKERFRYVDVLVNFGVDQPLRPGEARSLNLISPDEYNPKWSYEVTLECAIFEGGTAQGAGDGCRVLTGAGVPSWRISVISNKGWPGYDQARPALTGC